MRRLLMFAGVVAVFVAAVAATLPVDTLVRRALESVRQPGQPELVFARAVLRPAGLVLEEAELRAPDGQPLAATPWLAVRPSLMGLLRGARGFPWTVRALVCGTSVDVTVETAAEGVAAELRWHDADLAVCKGIALGGGGSLLGHAGSTARLALGGAGLPAGEGQIDLRDALFKAGPAAGGLVLRAATATVRWTLADGRIELTDVTMHGPDTEGTGHGEIRLGTPFPKSELDLDLDVTAGGSASSLIRALLDLLPAHAINPAHRRLVVTGTLERPQVVRQ